MLLLGRLARWPGIDRMLSGLTSIPTRVLDPLAQLAEPDAGDAPRGDVRVAVAAGLALRGEVSDE